MLTSSLKALLYQKVWAVLMTNSAPLGKPQHSAGDTETNSAISAILHHIEVILAWHFCLYCYSFSGSKDN